LVDGGFRPNAVGRALHADAKQWVYEQQREQIRGDAEYGAVDPQR
jgi:hypothetical protein